MDAAEDVQCTSVREDEQKIQLDIPTSYSRGRARQKCILSSQKVGSFAD